MLFLHQIVSLDLRNRWWRFFPLPSLHKDKHYRNNTIILMLQMAVVVSHFRWSGGWYLRSRPAARVGSKFPPKCQFFFSKMQLFFSQGRFFGDAELTIFLKGSNLRGKDPTIYKFRIWTILRVVLCPFIPAKTDYLNLSQRQYQNHIGQVPPRAAWRCLLRPRLTNLDGLVHQVHHLDLDMLSIMTTTVTKFFSQSLDLSSKECAALEDSVGGAEQLARITGSRAYERFRILSNRL